MYVYVLTRVHVRTRTWQEEEEENNNNLAAQLLPDLEAAYSEPLRPHFQLQLR
jgi:hypothetical protein